MIIYCVKDKHRGEQPVKTNQHIQGVKNGLLAKKISHARKQITITHCRPTQGTVRRNSLNIYLIFFQRFQHSLCK